MSADAAQAPQAPAAPAQAPQAPVAPAPLALLGDPAAAACDGDACALPAR